MRILVVITTIVILVGGLVTLKMKTKSDLTLRVSIPSQISISEYEPTNIHFAFEYLVLENIYSPLVEMHTDGSISPGVAESYEWVNGELHLHIRGGMKTVSGNPIDAKDVAFSLKRLLVLSKGERANTHGNFKDLVCPGLDLTHVNQDCRGIRVEGNAVILNPGGRKSFLLPMLAAIDFAVIPINSVDPKTLSIANFKETSGLYYVERDNGGGNIELRINPNHYHAAPNLAQSVVLVPVDAKKPSGALEAFDRGEVDHLMTSNGAKLEEILAYAKNRSDVQVHATMKIRKYMLTFTERGQRELSLDQRRWIGSQIRESVQDNTKGLLGYEPTEEFFPKTGDGSLSAEQLTQLKKIEISKVPLSKLRLAMIRAIDVERWGGSIKQRIPEVEVYREKYIPALHQYENPDEEPHAFIASADTGFMEDISVISYSLNAGLFGLTKAGKQKWLVDYMSLESSSERLKALRSLHFKALENAVAVPLLSSPFVALARKPWKMELSDLFANNQLWLVKQD